MPETLVIALGGNAITRPGEPGTIPQQFEHTAETLGHLVPLFRSDARIVITHGNGPQIGNILIRSEEGERRVPRLPLDTCVSDSQGGMGYMIQRILFELFRREGIKRTAATVITQVLVSEGDPNMVHPSKPIGRFYTTAEMAELRRDRPHWELGEIEPGPVSYTHLRAHETRHDLVCRLLLEKKKKTKTTIKIINKTKKKN